MGSLLALKMYQTCGNGVADIEVVSLADAVHTFQSNGVDWGFTSFLPLRDLMDPKKGFCVDDTIEV